MERYKNKDGQILGEGSDIPIDGSIATAEEVVSENTRILEASKPKIVTKLQMQKAMKELLLWDSFKTMRATDVALEDYWSDALEVNRYDPMVLAMGKTATELDALFLLASTK